jgi:thymidine kinase
MLIIGNRRSGKTTRLIQEIILHAAGGNGIIFTHSEKAANCLNARLRKEALNANVIAKGVHNYTDFLKGKEFDAIGFDEMSFFPYYSIIKLKGRFLNHLKEHGRLFFVMNNEYEIVMLDYNIEDYHRNGDGL